MDTRDQYGSRVGQKDAYGNPIEGHGHGVGGQPEMSHPASKEHHGGGILHHSNSSSSSSSEDDGMGGRRRKKGLKEKIKEKMPGGQKTTDDYGTGTGYAGTTGKTTATAGHRVEPEKKGMMDKIKEKLPGNH